VKTCRQLECAVQDLDSTAGAAGAGKYKETKDYGAHAQIHEMTQFYQSGPKMQLSFPFRNKSVGRAVPGPDSAQGQVSWHGRLAPALKFGRLTSSDGARPKASLIPAQGNALGETNQSSLKANGLSHI
jgi:hypothetical protein